MKPVIHLSVVKWTKNSRGKTWKKRKKEKNIDKDVRAKAKTPSLKGKPTGGAQKGVGAQESPDKSLKGRKIWGIHRGL